MGKYYSCSRDFLFNIDSFEQPNVVYSIYWSLADMDRKSSIEVEYGINIYK
jgi:hypothetical protein